MNSRLVFYTITAALGGLLFGYETAVINGAIPFLTRYFELTAAAKGYAISSALFGCIAGALLIGRPGDKYGRKKMLKLTALLFFSSAIGCGLASGIPTLIIFRFIGGIAVGGASVMSPLYISEISPPQYRGRLIVTFQLAIVTGILLAFFVDYLLIDSGPDNWRYMLFSMAIPALTFYLLLMFVDESPRWLVKEEKIEEARHVLMKINPENDADQTIRNIQDSIDNELIQKSATLFKAGYFKLILIGCAIGMFNQFTGINIVMYYTTDIFRSVGYSTNSAIAQTVAIGSVNLVFTILAMRLIDIYGRKKLLLTGTLGMAVLLGLFSFKFLTASSGGYALLFSLLGFTAFFASSQGAVIWVLLAEIFPNNIRARGTSIGSFSHWFFNGMTTFLFPVIINLSHGNIGIGYVFGFYSIMTFISFFVFRKYLMELKGRALESV